MITPRSFGLRIAGSILLLWGALPLDSARAQSYQVDIGSNVLFPLPSTAFFASCFNCGPVWNAVDAANPTPTALLDSNGLAAGVTVSHVGGQGNFQFDNGATPTGSDVESLMDDLQNVGPAGSTTTWTVHGLPNGIYRLYVYSWAPDDPMQRTRIEVINGLSDPQSCGAPVIPPWTWIANANVVLCRVGVWNGELSFRATAELGFGSVNGFGFEPVTCGVFSSRQYCTSKVNSQGCTPTWNNPGSPSASATSGFFLRVAQVLNQKPGLLLYGFQGGDAVPFAGGTLCVRPPLHRSIAVQSGGNPATVTDCSGAFALDMSAFAAGAFGGNPQPQLRVPGMLVSTQWWGRDPGFPAPDNVSLSSGYQYLVCP